MLWFPHCLDNRLTKGGKAISPKHRPSFTHQKQYFSASGTHFCYGQSKPQDLVQMDGLGKLKKKKNHLIGSRTRDLPACSIAPKQLGYSVLPYIYIYIHIYIYI
jgi:hypothetical protein